MMKLKQSKKEIKMNHPNVIKSCKLVIHRKEICHNLKTSDNIQGILEL